MSDNNFGEELGQLPPDLNLGATSEQIIRRGRRIRTIRQTSIVGAAAVAVFAITSIATFAGSHHNVQTVQSGSGNGLGIALAPVSPSPSPSTSSVAGAPGVSVGSGSAAPVSEAPSSAPASPQAWSAAATPAASSVVTSASPSLSCTTTSPAPQPTVGAPSANPDGNAPPWGTMVQAGSDVGTTTTLVLYGIHIDDAAIPCTHFGLMLGTVDAAGTPTGVYEANETTGSDLEPGFHGISMVGKEFAGTYLVGYYVGDAATISVVVNGVPTDAHVATWSVNSNVKFWWLGGSADGNPTYSAFTAKDANGTVLPVGNHAEVGVG